MQFDENIRIILKRYDLDQGLGDLLSERKALVVPEPEPDSDSNQERKDERERGEDLATGWLMLGPTVQKFMCARIQRGREEFLALVFRKAGCILL